MSDFRNITVDSSNPLVSVGVLSFNNARYIIQCLDSIKNQNYRPIELIVNDDKSSDNSVELINDWARKNQFSVKLLAQSKNTGISSSCNNVIEHSTGKYCTIVASDDYFSPDRINDCLNLLENASSKVGFLYSDIQYVDEDNSLLTDEWIFPFLSGNRYQDYMKDTFRMPAPTMFYRKEVFDRQIFDASLITEDVDFHSRILFHWDVAFLDKKSVYYRKDSHTSKQRRTDTSKINIIELSFKRRMKHWIIADSKAFKKELLVFAKGHIGKLYRKKSLRSFFHIFDLIFYFLIIITPLRNMFYSKKYFF